MIGWLAMLALSGPTVGDRLAPFNLITSTGSPFHWDPGKTTVLSFCAFWCDTWKDQLPRVREASQMTKGLPVQYATVSVDGRWAEKSKSAAVGTMLSDMGGEWIHKLGVDRVPYTVVVSPTGKIVWTGFGTVRTSPLVDAVRACIAGKSEEAGQVYLTFDDFPAEHLNHELLDVLRAEQVTATFFCMGSKAEQAKGVLRRAVREGHTLGVHSWDHHGDRPDVARSVAAIKDASGIEPTLYRPPGSEKVITLDGSALTLPIDDPYDYTRPGVDELVRRVTANARSRCVIQLHAGVSDTIIALPQIIKELRQRGFTFAVLNRRS